MYEWTLWFHIVSMVAWFAVLFYMPRLFVYHAEHIENSGFVEVVKVMEMKIYKYIGVPAFWATLLSGLLLIYLASERYGVSIFETGGWFHAKLLFVAFLILYFFSLGWMRKKLMTDSWSKSGKFFRIYNEVPTILLLLIVAMVIVKPF
jgi:putative membrane protein